MRGRDNPPLASRRNRPLSLTTRDLAVHFAGVKAVDGVHLELEESKIVGLIGPNGAGKTTLLNAITGFQRPTRGSIQVGDTTATGWSPQQFARSGISRTFQNARLFARLTVWENVEVAALGIGIRRHEARALADELVDLVALTPFGAREAGDLAYGDQRRLSLARALATNPAIVLLDEPAAGLDEIESDQLLTTLSEIRDGRGVGFMVIEHDMKLIMRLCDTVHVLDYGQTLTIGTPAQVQRDDRVLAAYLGTAHHRSRARNASVA